MVNMTMNGTPCTSKPVPMTAGSATIYLATTGLVVVGGAYSLARRRRRPRFATLDAV
jgi:LPXTG-motif cell wall-anchored protein